MPCTTILIGKNASYDGSTIIARNDDGGTTCKKLIIVNPKDQPKIYKSKISHVSIPLPDNPLRYSCAPNVNLKDGIWGACGINSENVAMSATETITSNPRVLGADPLVVYKKAKNKKEKDIIGGIGEEDLVSIVLPYIKSAKEGVYRIGELLEKYGTYEENGIALADNNEVWWLETIGGHHFIARKVKDDEYVIMPNQFGLDRFDFEDAYNEAKENICSKDLKEFVIKNNLDLDPNHPFNPRLAFGSHSDADHVYNTPRAWYMGRYFNPTTYKWDGENADFNPMSDNIPWALKPEKKITIEDVKYILSSYFQGTPYNPYSKQNPNQKGIYRAIGISRTDELGILQIRNNVPKEIAGLEWICFASNAFNSLIPLYVNVEKMPSYLASVSDEIVSTDNLYWNSRILGALADPHFSSAIMHIERYQNITASLGHQFINEYDAKMIKQNDFSLSNEANEKIASMMKEQTNKCLKNVLFVALNEMKNGYKRQDN